MSPPARKKLRPLPRNAPRSIEKTGRYKIRKGVRIRDYSVPLRRQGSTLSSTTGLEFQCRDGFTEDEAAEWRPQVVKKRCLIPHAASVCSPAVLLDQLPLHLKKKECGSVPIDNIHKVTLEFNALESSMRAYREAEGARHRREQGPEALLTSDVGMMRRFTQ